MAALSNSLSLKAQAKAFIKEQIPDLFTFLEQIVNINSHCTNLAGVNQVQSIIATELVELGMTTEFFEIEGQPKALIARSPGCKNKNIYFSLHSDTVYLPDTDFLKLEDHGDRFIGPGALDLKGALAQMLGVMRTAKHLGILNKLPIAVLITPDEESTSTVGKAVIEQLAPEIKAALIMEFARENDNILIDRFGIGEYEIEVIGKSAHSGNGFQDGANAFVQLGYTAAKLWALSDVSKYTFNPTNPKSGIQLNVIPDYASCTSDLRISSMSYMPEIEEHFRKLEQDIIVPGTKVSIKELRLSHPVEETAEAKELLASLIIASHEAGLKSQRSKTSRGASDGNIFASFKIPTCDGLGLSGGNAHEAGKEWVSKASMQPKIEALVYWLINELENPQFTA
ncbi:MAG: M20/M25/M40 family metallo-hydrolase [Bdellovibrionota bacterium]